MSKIPESGVALLREVGREILADPAHFDISCWWERRDCGAVMCIAGRIVAKTEPGFFEGRRRNTWSGAMVQMLAAKAIGLSMLTTRDLFLVTEWPKAMEVRYYNIVDPLGLAELAVQRIEQFITEHS